MNIGIISFAFDRENGQGLVNCEVAAAALRRGHHVTLFCVTVDPELAASPNVTVVPLGTCKLPSQLFRDQVLALRATLAVARRRHELDLVVCNGYVMWGRSDINSVHFLHHSWLASPSHPWRIRRTLDSAYRWLYSAANCLLERHALNRTEHIITVSERVRQDILALGDSPGKVTTIYNGVDIAQFRPGPSERERFGLPKDRTIGIFVGDIRTYRKNLDSVLKALVRVPDMHLVILGNLEGSPFPALANSLGVADRCHFLGFFNLDVLPTLFRSANFFVFPSRYEVCSLVLLQAAAIGLPIITARPAGGAELFAPDAALIGDDPEDIDWLADAMTRLRDDPELAARLGRSAQTIAERQTWAAATAHYLDIFEQIASGRSVRSAEAGLGLQKGV